MGTGRDVVIIGGGVIGGSIAYHMARRGLQVTLLERGRLGGEASGAAAGMLAAQAEMEEAGGPLYELARASREMYPALAEELREACGIDIGLVRRGMLKVALTEEQAGELQRIGAYQRSSGERADWLEADELRRREPGLSAAVRGGLYIPDDGQVSAPDLSLAFARSAAELGAEIREFAEVRRLLIESGRVKGIVTTEGIIPAERVVAASGVWTAGLFGQSELPCPLYPVKGEIFSVLVDAPLLRATIFSPGCYLVPKRGGRIVIGATSIPHSYDRKVSLAGIASLMERARELVPAIASAEWERAWSGLRPQTEDGLPILGEHPDIRGLFVAAGHYRNGILLAAATGRLAAGWALGEALPPELQAAFGLQRFRQSAVGGLQGK